MKIRKSKETENYTEKELFDNILFEIEKIGRYVRIVAYCLLIIVSYILLVFASILLSLSYIWT